MTSIRCDAWDGNLPPDLKPQASINKSWRFLAYSASKFFAHQKLGLPIVYWTIQAYTLSNSHRAASSCMLP